MPSSMQDYTKDNTYTRLAHNSSRSITWLDVGSLLQQHVTHNVIMSLLNGYILVSYTS